MAEKHPVVNKANGFPGRVSPASRSMEVILTLCPALVRHIHWFLCPSLASPVQKRWGYHGASAAKGREV